VSKERRRNAGFAGAIAWNSAVSAARASPKAIARPKTKITKKKIDSIFHVHPSSLSNRARCSPKPEQLTKGHIYRYIQQLDTALITSQRVKVSTFRLAREEKPPRAVCRLRMVAAILARDWEIMDQQLQEEWVNLREQDSEKLRTGCSPGYAAEQLVQLIVKPSFHPWVAWAVWKQKAAFTLVTTTWQLDIDNEKFRNPVERLRYPRLLEPTVDTTTTTVDASVVERIARELHEIRLPVYPVERTLALDGTSYELTTGLGMAAVTFRWHESTPASWQPLTDWVQERTPLFRQMSGL
jgi:hypothetical protein